MRDYGVISPKFWIGGTGKALRGNVEAQIVAVYLMTSPHANMIGVFYCPLDTIAKETGLPIEGASKGLQSLIEADFCQFDAATEEVFAVRMAAYQVGEQLEAKDNRCKGVARELERVMSDRLKAAFRAIYSAAFHLPPAPAKAPPPPPPAPSPLKAPPKPEAGTGTGSGPEAGTGDSANAGGEPPKPPPDPVKQEIWDAGRSLLLAARMPPKQVGTFLGKLVTDYTAPIVLEAVRAAVLEGPADPGEYLKACCMRAAGERKPGPRRPTSHNGLADKDYRTGVNPDGTLI